MSRARLSARPCWMLLGARKVVQCVLPAESIPVPTAHRHRFPRKRSCRVRQLAFVWGVWSSECFQAFACFRLLVGAMPPHTRRVMYLVWYVCTHTHLDTDWCLQSDVMPHSPHRVPGTRQPGRRAAAARRRSRDVVARADPCTATSALVGPFPTHFSCSFMPPYAPCDRLCGVPM